MIGLLLTSIFLNILFTAFLHDKLNTLFHKVESIENMQKAIDFTLKHYISTNLQYIKQLKDKI